MSVTIVIPSRIASTRLPEKPLALIHGRPMIAWVIEKAQASKRANRIVVATDNEAIFKAAVSAHAEAIMTPPELPSGTDRVAYVAKKLNSQVVVNVQGDEPMMDPGGIDRAIELVDSSGFPMATLACPLDSDEELRDQNVVKVITAESGRAIYFSRFPIPYTRLRAPKTKADGDYIPHRHLGIYVYRNEVLSRLSSLPPHPMELAESLEQLRALYHDIAIGVAFTEVKPLSVDTPEDLDRVRAALKPS